MGEFQRPRVQTEPVARRAVARIADDRGSEPSEVRADLVAPARFELDLDERALAARVERRVPSARRFRVPTTADADEERAVFDQGLVDHASRRFRPTLHQREVVLARDVPVVLHTFLDLLRTCEEEHAGRLAVDAVHGPQLGRLARRRKVAPHEGERRALGLAVGRDREQAGGFVDRDQVLVDEQHFDAERRRGFRRLGRAVADLDDVAGRHPCVGEHGFATDAHATGSNALFERGALPTRQRAAEEREQTRGFGDDQAFAHRAERNAFAH